MAVVSPAPAEPRASSRARRLWRRTLLASALLLLVWALLSVLAPWYARDLNAVRFAGFPLGYWIAAQGALLLFLAIVAVYAGVMNRLEAAYLRETPPDPGSAAGEDRGADPDEGRAAAASADAGSPR